MVHSQILSYPDGKSKGCGIVEFESAQEAQEAIAKMHDVEWMGRTLFCRLDRETKRSKENEKKLYVGNLPYSVAWQDLKDKFKEVGKVTYADVATDGRRSKGFGFVSFAEESEAEQAIGNSFLSSNV